MARRRNAVVIPIIAFLLGLAAAGLSFLAYAKRIKAADISVDKEGLCKYPSSPSLGIGILAAILILIHQILISVGTGCFCCGRDKLHCNICGIIALILFVLSWLSFIITFIRTIFTAIINDKSFLRNQQRMIIGGQKKDECLLGQGRLFLGAAIWCLITVFFGMSSYAAFKCGVKRHKDHTKRGPNFGEV